MDHERTLGGSRRHDGLSEVKHMGYTFELTTHVNAACEDTFDLLADYERAAKIVGGLRLVDY